MKYLAYGFGGCHKRKTIMKESSVVQEWVIRTTVVWALWVWHSNKTENIQNITKGQLYQKVDEVF